MRGKSKVLKVLLIVALSGMFCAASLAVAPAGEVKASCGKKGWYFAEGYTGGDFDTWILLQNPNKSEAVVELRFFTPQGEPIVEERRLEGETRYSIYLNALPGLEKQEVATEVTVKYADQGGIIAERAMYFNYDTGQGPRVGGHSTIGADRLSGRWFLPEGYTGGGFDTYVLLMNPNDVDANVQLKLMKPHDGKYYTFKTTVPAERRKTVKLDDLVWIKGGENTIAAAGDAAAAGGVGEPEPPVKFDDTDVSTLVYSDKPIIAERAMYFDYYGKAGGSSSIGATGAAPEWYLPEGYTGGEFDTWVMAMNPNHYPVDITYTFYSNIAGFEPVSITHAGVAPYSRDTIHVNKVAGLEGAEVSTRVTATRQVVLQASVPENANRYALLYAVDDYGEDSLEYAKSGMYKLKHRLVDYCGFDYSRMRYRSDSGVTVENLRKDMEWLAAVAGPDDIVVFYFGGRSDVDEEEALEAAALPSNYIKLFDGDVSQEQLAACFASLQTQKLVAMLSCDNAGGFLETLEGDGRIVMASCDAGENSHEYKALKSDVFTHYFVEGLTRKAADTNGNGRVSAEEAFAYAQDRVTAYVEDNSGESQVPQISDGIAGEVDLTVDRVPANIVAERSVYFRYHGVSDGATSIGAPRTYPNWFLAEGYTGGSFDTYVLVLNPYDNWQKLTVTFMTPAGVPIVKEYECPPNYRLTINVGEVPGLEATDVSTRVSAKAMDVSAACVSSGVVVERAMYFTYIDPQDGSRKAGGSCSIGYGTW